MFSLDIYHLHQLIFMTGIQAVYNMTFVCCTLFFPYINHDIYYDMYLFRISDTSRPNESFNESFIFVDFLFSKHIN